MPDYTQLSVRLGVEQVNYTITLDTDNPDPIMTRLGDYEIEVFLRKKDFDKNKNLTAIPQSLMPDDLLKVRTEVYKYINAWDHGRPNYTDMVERIRHHFNVSTETAQWWLEDYQKAYIE